MSREATHFIDELRGLNERVLSMGRLSEERVRLALQGLMGRNRSTLDDVIAGDGRLNAAQMDIDDRCFRMLALFHPVAVDLRTDPGSRSFNTHGYAAG